jgi:hypothetical protein
MAKHAFDLKTLARIGAASRLKQLEVERAQILKAFPGLRRPGSTADLLPRAPLSRRPPSAVARRAMSEGMRKFWARRKAALKR